MYRPRVGVQSGAPESSISIANRSMSERLSELLRRAELGGGEDRLRRQHDAGKLTARERIALLFDPGTFDEIDALVTHRCQDFGMADQVIPGDGVVCG